MCLLAALLSSTVSWWISMKLTAAAVVRMTKQKYDQITWKCLQSPTGGRTLRVTLMFPCWPTAAQSAAVAASTAANLAQNLSLAFPTMEIHLQPGLQIM